MQKKLHFSDDIFDYVICMTNTFGNLGDIKLDVLKEMKRVCKKNGKIFIGVYSEKAFDVRKVDVLFTSPAVTALAVERNGRVRQKSADSVFASGSCDEFRPCVG